MIDETNQHFDCALPGLEQLEHPPNLTDRPHWAHNKKLGVPIPGFPQALENHKKVSCMEKSLNLKKTLNNHGKIMELCEII